MVFNIGCEFFFPPVDDVEIIGTWEVTGENQYGFWKQRVVVEASRITNYWKQYEDEFNEPDEWETFWQATIYDYDNDIWNGGEMGRGDHGYLVMKYSDPSPYHPYSEGTFMVLRWENFNDYSGTMDWCEGFKIEPGTDIGDCGIDGYYCGVYFDTFTEAVETATESEGFFGMYSTIEKVN